MNAANDAGASRALNRELEAVKILKDNLADLVKDDPEFMSDLIEGQTNLFECINLMLFSIASDEIMADSIKDYIGDLSDRKSRIEKRAELKRTMVATAMNIAEIPRIEAPCGTVSQKATAPKAIVTEEADIPSKFFKAPTPKLDLKLLTEDLKARQKLINDLPSHLTPDERREAVDSINAEYPEIKGATLSNGGMTIQIRRK